MTEHYFDRQAKPAAIRAAARWFVRLRGPQGHQARPGYARWRLRDPARARAVSEVEAVWDLAGDLADDPAIRDLAERAPAVPAKSPPRASTWMRRAAAVLGAIGLGAGIVGLHGGIDPPAKAELYQTALGEQRSVTLSDGSVLHLDTATRLKVEMRPRRRDVQLLAGRARFTVARNPERPFVVEAGPARVQALGTIFDVRLEPGATAVNLFKGAVEVRNEAQASVRPVRLAPGDGVRVSPSSASLRVARFDRDGAWGWSDGRLIFAGASLADVAAEVNRYGSRRLIVAGGGGQRFRGELEAGDVEGAATILSALYDLSIQRAPNGDVVLARR